MSLTEIQKKKTNFFSQLIEKILNHSVKTMIFIAVIITLIIIFITGFWEPVSSTILPNTTFGLYNKSFWENILVEAHGFVLDIIVFGILIVGLDRRRNNREETVRMQEELTDYATLDTDELNVRKIGHIKRLQKNCIVIFNITQLTLNRMTIKNLHFTDSILIGLQLQNGWMTNISFTNTKMRSSYFNDTRIKDGKWKNCFAKNISLNNTIAKGVVFEECDLEKADFRDATLKNANFHKSNLKNAKFENSILDNANFIGVEDLCLLSLSKAKSLNYLKIEDEKLLQLKLYRIDMKGKNQATGESNPNT